MNATMFFRKSEFTPTEIAALSGKSLATIFRKIRSGEIESHRNGTRRMINSRELVKLLPPAAFADFGRAQ